MAFRLAMVLALALLGASGCKRTVTVSVIGAGEVMSQEEGQAISCPPRCEAEVDKGATLELHAAAPPGSRFEGWSGSCTGDGPCTVTAEENVAVSARFVRTAHIVVEVEGDGEGSLVSGQPCSKGCDLDLVEGEHLLLEAKPAEGMAFSGWGGACTGTGKCDIVATGEQKVTAEFISPVGTRLLTGRFEVMPGRRVVGITATAGEKGVTIGSTGSNEVELVHVDESGARAWTLLPKPEELAELWALARMDDDGFVVGGRAGRSDCALVRYRKDSQRAWRVALPDCGKIVDVAVIGDPGAEIVVALGQVGGYGSSYDFLGTPLNMKGNSDLFVARFDDSGALLGVTSFGTPRADEPRAMALSPDGAVAYVDTCSQKTCLLIALGADGTEMWTLPYDSDQITVRDLVATESSVYVVGDVNATKGKGGVGLLKGVDIQGAAAGCNGAIGLIARVARANGRPSSAKLLGASLARVIARDEDVVALGTYGPSLALLGRELGSGGCKGKDDLNAFVVGFSDAGEATWMTTFGDVATPFSEAIALERDGRALVLARGIGEASTADEAPPGVAHWMRLK